MTTTLCQTNALRVPAPLSPRPTDLPLRRVGAHLRDMLFGLVLAGSAAVIVYADEFPQGWVPEGLILPGDADFQMERAIGSSIRMFSFTTEASVDGLFSDWSAALEQDGYSIRAQEADLENSAIEFSGSGILNAKIAAAPSPDAGRMVITFDATLQ